MKVGIEDMKVIIVHKIKTSKQASKHKQYIQRSRPTHEASRIRLVGSDFAVNLDESLVHDFLHFIVRQSVLETVAQEHRKREAFSKLVRTAAGTRCLQLHASLQ